MSVALLVCGVIAVLYFALTFVLFQLVCRRFPSARDPWRRLTHATDALLEPYRPAIQAGQRWFQEHAADDVEITSHDGLALHGKFYENPAAGPVLIACHGYRSNGERDFSAACPFYFEKGFSLLLIDQRACGKSQGKYLTLGVRERLDARDWCRFVQERCPGAPILLVGISMGASAVLMAAPELPEAVAVLLADCGYVSPREELSYIVRHNVHIPAAPLLWGVDLWCRLLAGFGLSQCSTVEALAENDRPVFFIHGQADGLVPFENSLKSRAACSAPSVLFSVADADHGMSYLLDPDGYHAAVGAFLRQYLPLPSSPNSAGI